MMKLSNDQPPEGVKVKAHAYTMGAVVMLFFFPFAVFGVLLGIKQGEPGPLLLGAGTLLLHGWIIYEAVVHFRKEKAKKTIWIKTEWGVWSDDQ
jgi:hypothetical protein